MRSHDRVRPWESPPELPVRAGRIEPMSDTLGISAMTDDETLNYIEQLERERSVLDARMSRAMAHFHQLRRPIEGGRYGAEEVAALLSWSPRIGSSVMDRAVRLADRLPDTVVAMESGRLDMTKAAAILGWTDPLPVEQAREVAGIVTEWSVGRTPTAVRKKLSREIVKIDPEGAQARHRERVKHRSVSFFAGEDGMATLSVYDSGERIRALFELLDHVARQAKAAGDPGTLDTLRADAFTCLLMGGQRPQVELRVTVPASVLAGTSNAPGWLHGYGPVTSQTVWELAEQSEFWRRVITDPATGTVVEVSRRRPTTGLRDYVNARTPTCVGVGCGRPAESCETDHTHDYALGGATAAHNLGPACRRHNLMKLDGGRRP